MGWVCFLFNLNKGPDLSISTPGSWTIKLCLSVGWGRQRALCSFFLQVRELLPGSSNIIYTPKVHKGRGVCVCVCVCVCVVLFCFVFGTSSLSRHKNIPQDYSLAEHPTPTHWPKYQAHCIICAQSNFCPLSFWNHTAIPCPQWGKVRVLNVHFHKMRLT